MDETPSSTSVNVLLSAFGEFGVRVDLAHPATLEQLEREIIRHFKLRPTSALSLQYESIDGVPTLLGASSSFSEALKTFESTGARMLLTATQARGKAAATGHTGVISRKRSRGSSNTIGSHTGGLTRIPTKRVRQVLDADQDNPDSSGESGSKWGVGDHAQGADSDLKGEDIASEAAAVARPRGMASGKLKPLPSESGTGGPKSPRQVSSITGQRQVARSKDKREKELPAGASLGARHSRFVRFEDGSIGNGLFTDAEFRHFFRKDSTAKPGCGAFPAASTFTGTKGQASKAEKACKALEKATRTLASIERFYRSDSLSGGLGVGLDPGSSSLNT